MRERRGRDRSPSGRVPSGAGVRHVVVVGSGRLGRLIAGRLSGSGADVVVVDRDPAAFRLLPPEFSGFTLHGDAVEPSTLREADIERADVLVAATEDDDVNLMVAQVAQRVFGVATVIARVYDLRREPVYAELGVDTISPTRLTAEAIEMLLVAREARRGGRR